MSYNVRMTMRLSLAGLILWLACTSTKDTQQYRVRKGAFRATLTETGELQAVRSRIMTVPYIGWKYGGRMKVVGLLDHGAGVAPGDSVAEMDPSGVTKFLMERQNRLDIEQANLKKLLVQHRSLLKGLETERASAEASLTLSRIQLEKHQFESERNRRIKELEYEKEQIRFRRIQRKRDLTRIRIRNELHIQKLKIFQLENEIEDAQSALLKLVIRSPLNGIMQVLDNRRTGQMVRVGDDLYQGHPLTCIPDLSRMKVTSTVHETDIARIALDQRAIVRLDAFPSISFEGKIIDIGKLSYKKDEKSQTKVFDIVILLDTSDPILKPGMTVKCEIFTAQLDEVHYVENNCILKEEGGYYLLMSKRGRRERQEIRLGPRNNRFTVIYGDVREGQRVVPLSEMAERDRTGADT